MANKVGGPQSVKLAGYLYIALGVGLILLFLYFGVYQYFTFSQPEIDCGEPTCPATLAIFHPATFLFLILALVQFGVGFGLLRGSKWFWSVALIFSTLSIAFCSILGVSWIPAAINDFYPPDGLIATTSLALVLGMILIPVLINMTAIYYLFKHEAKIYFYRGA
jgi:hypothetical protein